MTREIGEPLCRLALLVKAKGGRDSVICVDPALNTRAPSEELDDGCWIGHCEQLVVGLVKAGDERLDRFCVEAGILWELDFNVPGLPEIARFDREAAAPSRPSPRRDLRQRLYSAGADPPTPAQRLRPRSVCSESAGAP